MFGRQGYAAAVIALAETGAGGLATGGGWLLRVVAAELA
jgi:hypothetical protein